MKNILPNTIYCLMMIFGSLLLVRQPPEVSAEATDAQANVSMTIDPLQAEPEKLPDPFLTDDEWRDYAAQDKNITWMDPNISAIFYSSQSSTVIVSGRVLRVNDFIDGRQIIAIRPESVVLKDKKGTYVVKMGSVLWKQPAQIVKTE
jgi:hypothetical protein